MMDFFKKRKHTTLLGIAIDGSQVEGVLLHRTNGSVVVQKEFTTSLSLDFLVNEPELVGREIRNKLDELNIGKQHCVACLPLEWALQLQIKLPPDLPEADLDALLHIEAEKGFPVEPDTLLIQRSVCRLQGGDAYAMLIAFPKDRIERLEQVCKGANLVLDGVSLGISSLMGTGGEGDELAMCLGEKNISLQINTGGGVWVLRSLAGITELKGEKEIETEQVTRELRITLGQLPAEIRARLKKLRLFGSAAWLSRAEAQLRPIAKAIGLTVESSLGDISRAFGLQLSGGQQPGAALWLALRKLSAQGGTFDFLPPKVTLWQQMTARYSSGKLVWAAGTAGVIALLVGLVFLVQQWQWMSVNSQWEMMRTKVADLEKLQTKIRKFRPWYDEFPISLTIIRNLTEAFPEDGSVTAKSIEINSKSVVTCSGMARDNQSLLKTLDRLGAFREVSNVKVEQIRGKTPLQFTFNFHWTEGGKNEN